MIEGFGANTTGGEVENIVWVTRMDDSSPAEEGMFRWAVQQGDSKTIMFSKAGVIALQSAVWLGPNTTIDGSTAPSPGVCLTGGIKLADNCIVKYLRIRPNNVSGDGIEIIGNNIVIDHCSLSWCHDEAIGFKRNQSLESTDPPIPRNTTIQWCIISECEKGILGWFAHNTTMHHNLFAHCAYRTPVACGSNNQEVPSVLDIRNNVVYDAGSEAGTAQEFINVNYIGNYYKLGNPTRGHVYSITVKPDSEIPSLCKIFLSDHYGPHVADGEDMWNEIRTETGGVADRALHEALEEFSAPPVVTESAQGAYNSVLEGAGAILPVRDETDKRIVTEVINTSNTGIYPRGPEDAQALADKYWPTLNYEGEGSEPTPTPTPTQDVEVDYGKTLIAIPIASDQDGDEITYNYQWSQWDGVAWQELDGETQNIYKPPTTGFFQITVIPNDGLTQGDPYSLTVEVVQYNRPPVVESVEIQYVD